ncbi:tetratricopeptide repeat protein [Enterococcus ratti]|uniref:tetratricopeptide repeat protein n=1 Tax=Enterococcus ratti TaxID=150033 RepID=UPI0035146021
MFKRFQRKKAREEEMSFLSKEERRLLHEEVEQLNQAISSCEDLEKLAVLLEQTGLKYVRLGENKKAITVLEESLATKVSIGEGYKKLITLYNEYRKEAAQKGDIQAIDYYMGKLDEMRQIAKKGTIKGTN